MLDRRVAPEPAPSVGHRKRARLPLLVAAVLVLSLPSAGTAWAERTDDEPVVRVQTRTPVADVSPHLTGSNIDQWWDEAHGLWDSEAGAPDADVVAKTRRAGVGKIRFPGGAPANLYNWKRAIGPVEERGCQVDGRRNGTGRPLDGRYGPDEFMRFANATGADPTIMTPMINGTPADAADWVEYMNAPVGTDPRGGKAWAEVRADNGHPEPYGVKHWEIGNEPDRGGQNYWRSTDRNFSLRQYAFGGNHPQVGQGLARGCDRRAAASMSDGTPDQEFQLHFPPAVPESQTVYVDGVAWREVADLSRAGAGDRVYEFDPATGAVRFGDGTHGAVPHAGAQLSADYVAGPKPGFVDFYAAMKDADPSIDVCATWAPVSENTGLGGTSFPELMAAHGRSGGYDCVVIHPYTNFGRDFGDRDWETAREGHDEYMLGEAKAARLVSDLQAEVAEHSTGDAYVSMSEFGALWFGGMDDLSGYPTPSWHTAMSHTTYMASQWARYSQLGVPWAMGNTLISETPEGLRAVFGGAPEFVVTTEATVREQLKPVLAAAGSVVHSEVHENPTVTPVEPEPGFGDYEALVSSAMLGEDGRLRILVVNRHPEQAIRAQVVPDGYRQTGEVAVSTVAGDHFTSYNSIEHPFEVQLEHAVVTVRSAAFRYTFPAHSVTVLELSSAR